jgi:hypothetical protein
LLTKIHVVSLTSNIDRFTTVVYDAIKTPYKKQSSRIRCNSLTSYTKNFPAQLFVPYGSFSSWAYFGKIALSRVYVVIFTATIPTICAQIHRVDTLIFIST